MRCLVMILMLLLTVFAPAPLPLRASEHVGVTQASEPQIGTWGDQVDGTYRNPILNADYPDVDVEQLGDTYYMISSKQHMAPGMVILESKDMVNWTTIGHVWSKLSWLDPALQERLQWVGECHEPAKRLLPRHELYEDVDIAVGSRLVARDRAEQREACHRQR